MEKRNMGDSDTAPLLLDAVLTPISEPNICNYSSEGAILAQQCNDMVTAARVERDQALLLARQYRDAAEVCQNEKREMKYNLEKKIEVIRSFWRNKVVEGGSRSGRILRAALIRK